MIIFLLFQLKHTAKFLVSICRNYFFNQLKQIQLEKSHELKNNQPASFLWINSRLILILAKAIASNLRIKKVTLRCSWYEAPVHGYHDVPDSADLATPMFSARQRDSHSSCSASVAGTDRLLGQQEKYSKLRWCFERVYV